MSNVIQQFKTFATASEYRLQLMCGFLLVILFGMGVAAVGTSQPRPQPTAESRTLSSYATMPAVVPLSPAQESARLEAAKTKQAHLVQEVSDSVTLILFADDHQKSRKMLAFVLGLLLLAVASFGIRGCVAVVGLFGIMFAVM